MYYDQSQRAASIQSCWEARNALADDQRNKEKSEQENYAKLDKGRDADIIHTNGSTPKNRL